MEQLVQLVFKGGHQQIHAALDAVLGFGDVRALHRLPGKAGVGVQQLECGGQVVVHKLLQLRFLVRVLLRQRKNTPADFFQPGDLLAHHRVGDGIVHLPQLAQQGGVLVLCGRMSFRYRSGRGLFRLWRSAPHHQCVGAVVDVGICAEVSVLDGAFHGDASPGGIHPGGGKQLRQGDVIPFAHNFIQQPLQLAGAVHPQAGQQRTAAANDHGDIREQAAEARVKPPDLQDVHRIRHAGKQKDRTHDGAEGGNVLVPLLGAFLRLGRHIVSVNRLTLPVGLRPKVGAVVAPGMGGLLLLLLHLLVDALQDEQQHPQRPGHRHDDKDGNGGDLCKIMFSRLHETEFLSQKDKIKTVFHSIIAERGLFVKGVFLLP